MKYVVSLVLMLASAVAYAGNCHVNQVQAVVAAPVVQFVEVPHLVQHQAVLQVVQPVRHQVVVEKVQVQKVVKAPAVRQRSVTRTRTVTR